MRKKKKKEMKKRGRGEGKMKWGNEEGMKKEDKINYY